MEYAAAAWERAMLVQEVMLKAIGGELHWFRAAEILGTLVPLMNDLYAQEWSPFTNHVKPTFKRLKRAKKNASGETGVACTKSKSRARK